MWFVFNMAVFMNQYFRHRCQKAKVVSIYWKNVRHSRIFKALKVDMHCGDMRKYHGETTKQQRTGELELPQSRLPQDPVPKSCIATGNECKKGQVARESGKQVVRMQQGSGKRLQNHDDGASIPQPFEKDENKVHVGRRFISTEIPREIHADMALLLLN